MAKGGGSCAFLQSGRQADGLSPCPTQVINDERKTFPQRRASPPSNGWGFELLPGPRHPTQRLLAEAECGSVCLF